MIKTDLSLDFKGTEPANIGAKSVMRENECRYSRMKCLVQKFDLSVNLILNILILQIYFLYELFIFFIHLIHRKDSLMSKTWIKLKNPKDNSILQKHASA